MPRDAHQIRSHLERAFLKRAYPGDQSLANTRPWLRSYEGNQVAAYFKGKVWQEISLDHLTKHYPGDSSATFHFMTEVAFLYYLPAFLSMSLDLPNAGLIAAGICNSFSMELHNDPRDRERAERRIRAMSSEERDAVVDALSYLAAEYERREYPDNPARRALAAFYGIAGH
jgi:hypothetical protein